MVFSSYVVGLFGLFILEFSLWNNFGNYIWYVSIGFTILDMFVGDIVSYQLKEVGGVEFFWRECRPVSLGPRFTPTPLSDILGRSFVGNTSISQA